MNHWPPPSADDAPTPPPEPPVPALAWWQRPIAHAMLVAFVFAGVIALVAIGFVRALDSDSETSATTSSAVPAETSQTTTTLTELVTIPAVTSETTQTTRANADAPDTTTPRVQSAPPVPPASGDGTPTIVVTLPPTATTAASAAADLPVIQVEINFTGAAGDGADPDGEWVRFVNDGTEAVDMTGWLVRDDGFENGHVFEPLTLQPGASVTLFSGCGFGSDTVRYFCVDEVWDDGGDVVSLLNRSGVLVVQRHG